MTRYGLFERLEKMIGETFDWQRIRNVFEGYEGYGEESQKEVVTVIIKGRKEQGKYLFGCCIVIKELTEFYLALDVDWKIIQVTMEESDGTFFYSEDLEELDKVNPHIQWSRK